MIRAPKLSQRLKDRARGAAGALIRRVDRMTAAELRPYAKMIFAVKLPISVQISYSGTHSFESCRLAVVESPRELLAHHYIYRPFGPADEERAALEGMIVRKYVGDYIGRRYPGRPLYDWTDEELGFSEQDLLHTVGGFKLEGYDREKLSLGLTAQFASSELSIRQHESNHERIVRLAAQEARSRKMKKGQAA